VALVELLQPAFVTVEEVPDFICFNPNKQAGQGQAGCKGRGAGKGRAGGEQAEGGQPSKRRRSPPSGSSSRRLGQLGSEGGDQAEEEDARMGDEEEEGWGGAGDADSSTGGLEREGPKERWAPFLQVRACPASAQLAEGLQPRSRPGHWCGRLVRAPDAGSCRSTLAPGECVLRPPAGRAAPQSRQGAALLAGRPGGGRRTHPSAPRATPRSSPLGTAAHQKRRAQHALTLLPYRWWRRCWTRVTRPKLRYCTLSSTLCPRTAWCAPDPPAACCHTSACMPLSRGQLCHRQLRLSCSLGHAFCWQGHTLLPQLPCLGGAAHQQPNPAHRPPTPQRAFLFFARHGYELPSAPPPASWLSSSRAGGAQRRRVAFPFLSQDPRFHSGQWEVLCAFKDHAGEGLPKGVDVNEAIGDLPARLEVGRLGALVAAQDGFWEGGGEGGWVQGQGRRAASVAACWPQHIAGGLKPQLSLQCSPFSQALPALAARCRSTTA
jgi:hypothetical protein